VLSQIAAIWSAAAIPIHRETRFGSITGRNGGQIQSAAEAGVLQSEIPLTSVVAAVAIDFDRFPCAFT
jgi:hypothetical protein